MKKMNKIGLIVALCFLQLFIQCTNDDGKKSEKETTEKETNEINQLRNFLSKSLGMALKKIIYDSGMNSFIIDGDVLMPLDEARDRFNHSNLKTTDKTFQRSSQYKMNPEVSSSVKIYVSPDVPIEWKTALNTAINKWNNTNSSINITTTDASSANDIKITMIISDKSKAIAFSSLPYYNGKPGNNIAINPYFNSLAASKKVNAMIHELGHCFGFNHTNQTEGELIPCTPLSDVYSVMYSTSEDRIDGFSAYDIIAISTLYPVTAGTIKLYRYTKNQYYYYSTNPCEITPGKDGYVFDGDAGYLYAAQIQGTVPLYRILNGSNLKDHRLSTFQTSADDVVLGYLYPAQEPGTTPLFTYIASYEYFPSNKHYLYTTNFDKDNPLAVRLGYVRNKVIHNESADIIL